MDSPIRVDPAAAKAVAIAGSQRKLARQVCVSQQTIGNWLRFGISRGKVADVVNATGGRVTWQECFPDVIERVKPEFRT